MSKHLLSSVLAAALAAAPALVAQTAGQRDTDTTDRSRTQSQGQGQGRQGQGEGQTEGRDRDRSGTSTTKTQDQTSKTQDQSQTGARAGAGGQASSGAELRNNERQFLMEAAQKNMAEVELGKIAQERASNPEVKEYAEKMVEEHTKALEELKTTASTANVDIPTEVQAKNKATANRLSKLSGEDFDRAYMQHMVQDHKNSVNKFERTSKNARNEAVKNYATQTLPHLREHLQQAQQIHGQVAGKGTASRQRDASGTTTQDQTSPAGRTGDQDRTSPTGRPGDQDRTSPAGRPGDQSPTGSPRDRGDQSGTPKP